MNQIQKDRAVAIINQILDSGITTWDSNTKLRFDMTQRILLQRWPRDDEHRIHQMAINTLESIADEVITGVHHN